jgi:hypothetical protein
MPAGKACNRLAQMPRKRASAVPEKVPAPQVCPPRRVGGSCSACSSTSTPPPLVLWWIAGLLEWISIGAIDVSIAL